MLNLGTVKPGSTIYIPFDSFDGGTGASITLTGLATTDIEVYKNGSNTTRVSDTGYALLGTDGIDEFGTGIHGISIDLSSNADAGFFAAGAFYHVVIASVTIDAQTVNFVAATFTIGQPDAVLNTTIATLATQTSFTLTAGPAEDDALNGCVVYVHDVASAVQGGFAVIQDYTGVTKTVTLTAGVSFTAAATDNISIFPPSNAQWGGTVLYTATRGLAGTALPAAAADAAGGLPISDAGGLDLDTKLANTNEVTAARMGALTDWINGGRLDLILDIIAADTTTDIPALLPAALVGGRMDSSVGAVVDGILTAAKFAAGAFDAVWTVAVRVLTANTNLNDLSAAGVRTAVGLASANLDTQLSAIDDFLDTEMAAVLVDTGTTLDDLVDDLEARLTQALADKLTAHAAAVLTLAVGVGSTTTAVVLSTVNGAAPSATNDFYNGRVVIFTSGTLAGQAVEITDYDGATVTATVSAATSAPANGVTGVIV